MNANANNSKNEDLSKKTFNIGKEFQAVERLGNGSYGTVYKVKKNGDTKFYAIKIIENELDKEGIPFTVLREIAILKKMKNPNVVNIEGIAFNKNQIELCLEYCKFDLQKLIDSKKFDSSFYNEKFIKNIMYQLLKGVNHLHTHGILHRDLKPNNILVDDKGWILKIADFGLSRVYSIPIRPYSKAIQTLWYKAPEILLEINKYAIGVDIWSIGCIFVELYLGQPFVMGDSDMDQLFKLFQIYGPVNELTLPVYKAYTNSAQDFPYEKGIGLQNYLNGRNQIIKIDELASDLMKKMLAFDPCKRITCKEALNHPYFNGVVCTCNYSN